MSKPNPLFGERKAKKIAEFRTSAPSSEEHAPIEIPEFQTEQQEQQWFDKHIKKAEDQRIKKQDLYYQAIDHMVMIEDNINSEKTHLQDLKQELRQKTGLFKKSKSKSDKTELSSKIELTDQRVIDLTKEKSNKRSEALETLKQVHVFEKQRQELENQRDLAIQFRLLD